MTAKEIARHKNIQYSQDTTHSGPTQSARASVNGQLRRKNLVINWFKCKNSSYIMYCVFKIALYESYKHTQKKLSNVIVLNYKLHD